MLVNSIEMDIFLISDSSLAGKDGRYAIATFPAIIWTTRKTNKTHVAGCAAVEMNGDVSAQRS